MRGLGSPEPRRRSLVYYLRERRRLYHEPTDLYELIQPPLLLQGRRQVDLQRPVEKELLGETFSASPLGFFRALRSARPAGLPRG